MNDSTAAVMPGSEENTTLAAMMFDILERTHHKRDAAETAAEADQCSPTPMEE